MRRIHFLILLLLISAALIISLMPTAVRYAFAPGYTPIDLRSLCNFPIDQTNGTDSDIPARLRKLDGRRVVLRGFMYAGRSAAPQSGDFQLVHNVAHSHGPPLVQDRVFATTPHGTVPYYYGTVEVEGTLHVGVVNPNGDYIHSLFRLDVDHMKPIAAGIPVTAGGAIRTTDWLSAAVLVLAMLGVPSAVFFLLIRAPRRPHAGERLCHECGYDLRASPTRCPECGSAVDSGSSITPADLVV